jgi:hypothetical protein
MQREENHSVPDQKDGQVKEEKQQEEGGSVNGMVGSLARSSHNHKYLYKHNSVF